MKTTYRLTLHCKDKGSLFYTYKKFEIALDGQYHHDDYILEQFKKNYEGKIKQAQIEVLFQKED